MHNRFIHLGILLLFGLGVAASLVFTSVQDVDDGGTESIEPSLMDSEGSLSPTGAMSGTIG